MPTEPVTRSTWAGRARALLLHTVGRLVKLPSKPTPFRDRQERRRLGESGLHDAALTEMLLTTPNQNVLGVIYLTSIPPLVHGHIDDRWLMIWVALTLLFSFWSHAQLQRFRRASTPEREQDRLHWRRFGAGFPLAWGALFVVIAAPTFGVISLKSRILLTWLACGGVILGAVYAALVARPLIVMVGGCLILQWAYSGEPDSFCWSWVTLLTCSLAWMGRKINAQRTHDRVTSLRENQRLTQSLRVKNRILTNLEDERSYMLAVVGHDLRQPVHALSLLVGGWDAQATPDQHRQRIQLIQSRVGLIGDMLRSLLDSSQLNLGEYRVDETRFNLTELLQEIFDTFADRAAGKGLAYSCRNDAGHLAITTDRGLLARSIGNLISNAIKYTDKGKVELRAERLAGGGLRIIVADTGIGIPLERQEEIFLPYLRLDTSRKSDQGLGLGLSVVKQTAKLLGFGVGLTSQLGTGTDIHVDLPEKMLMMSTEPSAPYGPAVAAQKAARAGRNILVVEDDHVTLMAMLELLSARGFEVRGASGVDEALSWVTDRAFVPDLLLTDFQLPGGIDGIQCLRAIRATSRLPALPVVVVSGDLNVNLGKNEHREKIRILRKPTRPKQIYETISQILIANAQDPSHSAMEESPIKT